MIQASPREKIRLYLKNNQNEKDWERGSGSRASLKF
jgi:hypothetical protein